MTEIGERLCQYHADASACTVCRRVGPRTADGSCRTCTAGAVRTNRHALDAAAPVLAWMTELIGSHRMETLPVLLVREGEIAAGHLGETSWCWSGGSLTIEIRIREGLPLRTFQQVLAHEFGHVLLVADPMHLGYVGSMDPTRLMEEEGFCEVLVALWLLADADSLAALDLRDLNSNPDPLYGGGFRIMWPRYERHQSVRALRAELLGLRPDRPTRPWREEVAGIAVDTPAVPAVGAGGSHRPHVPFPPNSVSSVVSVLKTPSSRRPLVPVNLRPAR